MDDSDSDSEAAPQFLTRNPPSRTPAKLTPHNMQLPGTSKFKKRQPQAADDLEPDEEKQEREQEAEAVLTTSIHAAGAAASDDFSDMVKTKKKKKNRLGSLALELKPTQAQLDEEAAEAAAALAAAAAARAAITDAIEQEAAEARLAAEVAAAAAVEKATFVKSKARPASASASYAGTNTPPCGTLYVQKEMPTRTVRTIKFATRGIPGQQPRAAPKAFPAPNGYPFESDEWRDGAYEGCERRRLQRESRSASARERRAVTRTVDLKRWGGRAPASPQLNSTNTTNNVKGGGNSSSSSSIATTTKKKKKQQKKKKSIKQKGRPQSASASSLSSSPVLLSTSTSTSSRLLWSTRPPRSASAHSLDGFKMTQKMSASMFQHRRPRRSPSESAGISSGPNSRKNEAVDAALRRSMGLGKNDDLLDALLAANSTPSTSSPDRPSRFRNNNNNSYSHSALTKTSLTKPFSRPFSAGPCMSAPA